MARKLFLEGKWQDGVQNLMVRSPWDQRAVVTVSLASKPQAERAVLFAQTGASRLRRVAAGHRREILRRTARGLESKSRELAEAICAEAGKPIAAARLEVARAIEVFELAAAELSTFGGGVVPVDLTSNALHAEAEVRRYPAGVVVGIVPFNFPLNLGAHKVAPAMAVGAPIIIKPPLQAPTAMLMLAELTQLAGADPAALQVVPCEDAVAEALATDARVRVVSFTGSAKVGWHLKSVVKGKCVLELGGNAAAIVCADADVPTAAHRLALSAFGYSGQVCIKAQRIIVESAAWDVFVERFLSEVVKLGQGDPAREETVIGPVIDERSAARIESWVAEALAAGARPLLVAPREGTRVKPVVLCDVPRFSKVYSEEVFGPVVVLERVADFAAAVDAANDSAYGLQAGLFTNDLQKVRKGFHELEVGGVIVNDAPSFRSDNMPYGGVKQSGLGREGVRYAMADFTEERVLVYR